MNPKLNAYAKRNRLLKKLGFRNYQEYLNSDLWKKLRSSQLRNHPACYACGKTATQVHHARYTPAVLLGHEMAGLRSMCGDCHYRIEFHKNAAKRTLHQAERALKRRRKWLHPRQVIARIMEAPERDDVDRQYRERMQREK